MTPGYVPSPERAAVTAVLMIAGRGSLHAGAINCSCSTTTKPTDVTALRIKDVTGALRARRYRAKKNGNEIKPSVTVEPDFDAPGVTVLSPERLSKDGRRISTPEMCALAARLGDGRASHEDLRLTERLIMALVNRLPADSMIEVSVPAGVRYPMRYPVPISSRLL
jgi:hypothetical protein